VRRGLLMADRDEPEPYLAPQPVDCIGNGIALIARYAKDTPNTFLD
jgi:hypothetical protein